MRSAWVYTEIRNAWTTVILLSRIQRFQGIRQKLYFKDVTATIYRFHSIFFAISILTSFFKTSWRKRTFPSIHFLVLAINCIFSTMTCNTWLFDQPMAYTCIGVIIFCFTSRKKHQIKKTRKKSRDFTFLEFARKSFLSLNQKSVKELQSNMK